MTGDPSTPLPCDGMLDETDAMIARVTSATAEALAMLHRHRDALASCRKNRWCGLASGTETGK